VCAPPEKAAQLTTTQNETQNLKYAALHHYLTFYSAEENGVASMSCHFPVKIIYKGVAPQLPIEQQVHAPSE
jgi:hypothetical protein